MNHATAPENLRYIADREWLNVAIDIITRARVSLKISTYIFDDSTLEPSGSANHLATALMMAPQRIKHCRLMVANKNQHITKKDPSHDAIAQLQAAGWHVRRSIQAHKSHAKLIISDAETTLIGSHNFASGSMFHNHEASALITSAAFAYRAENHFDAAYATAKPLT